MNALLAFENSPPYAAPLRFFLTAPLFAAAAGGVMITEGGGLLLSRWAGPTLSLVHLMTVGFLLTVMLGALIQVLPVVAGAAIARPRLLAPLIHVLLTVGAILLAAGLWTMRAVLLLPASALLAVAVLVFLGAAGMALWPVRAASPTIPALKLALAGLLATVILGLLLIGGVTGGLTVDLVRLTPLHAVAGLLAWCAALLIGVAFVVVPMFQLTPGYPAKIARWLVPSLLTGVLVWALVRATGVAAADFWALPTAAAIAVFAGQTLRLQAHSKRATPDVTFRYWRLGMIGALAAVGVWVVRLAGASLLQSEAALLAWGALILFGALVPVLSGMLYKIVPFLAWMHLQQQTTAHLLAGGARVAVPNMKRLLDDRQAERQYRLYAATLILTLASPWLGDLAVRLAGVGVAASFLWLWLILAQTARRYVAVASQLGSQRATA